MGEHERARPRVLILGTQLRKKLIGRVGRQGERMGRGQETCIGSTEAVHEDAYEA
jgi:hypothetical protein